jgi:translation initiation factor 4E
MLTKET